MNRKAIFAALFIAIMAMSAVCASPAAATPQSSPTPQREMAPTLTIPSSLRYEINGTLFFWINASGHLYITSSIPGLSSYNFTVKQVYVGLRLSAAATSITINSSTRTVTANISVNARLVIIADIYLNVTNHIAVSKQYDHIVSWPAKWLLPANATDTFVVPFPMFDMDPTAGTGSTDPVNINFDTTHNSSWLGTQYNVSHRVWDFSDWLKTKVQNGLDAVWSKVMSNVPQSIPGIQGGFNVARAIGRVELWKTRGTSPDNILLAASGVIDLLIDWSLVGHGSTNVYALGTYYSLTYNVDFAAEIGLQLSLLINSNWQIATAASGGHYSMNTLTVLVPQNATLVRKNVTVIVYYGSPPHGCDVTGGASRGNFTVGGQVLFFVDYGWNGTPDFLTNGTTADQLTNAHGTVTGSGNTRTVTLSKGGSWIYFDLDISGYTVKDVKRNDGVTLNVTQYWTYNGTTGNKMLYVVDDPAYQYTVELIGGPGGGLTTTLLLGIGVVAVIAVLALVVLVRRRSSSSGVSVKVV